LNLLAGQQYQQTLMMNYGMLCILYLAEQLKLMSMQQTFSGNQTFLSNILLDYIEAKFL